MPTHEEIRRAIQEFEDNAYHQSKKPDISEASKAVALAVMRSFAGTLFLKTKSDTVITLNVIDPKTGTYPDLCDIALKEIWANGLCYCDMEGFAVTEDGHLILMDECGKYEFCPYGRFEHTFTAETKVGVWNGFPHAVSD